MTTFKVNTLEVTSYNKDETLPLIISLSNDIFSPDPTSKYASLDVWEQRLSSPSSIILYITLEDSIPPVKSDNILAFIFVYPRTHQPPLHDGESETLHVWLAGVRPQWRRFGLLGKLIDEFFAKRSTATTVTICTVPQRFTDMWSWLTKRGWKVERGSIEAKVLLSKRIRKDSQ
jgi:hypothetical protein